MPLMSRKSDIRQNNERRRVNITHQEMQGKMKSSECMSANQRRPKADLELIENSGLDVGVGKRRKSCMCFALPLLMLL